MGAALVRSRNIKPWEETHTFISTLPRCCLGRDGDHRRGVGAGSCSVLPPPHRQRYPQRNPALATLWGFCFLPGAKGKNNPKQTKTREQNRKRNKSFISCLFLLFDLMAEGSAAGTGGRVLKSIFCLAFCRFGLPILLSHV